MAKQTKGDIAKAYFEQGYNCAQAVAMSFADLLDMDENQIAKMVSGFGGGIGRQREVCGTISGLAFVYSALYGYNDPKDNAVKKDVYSDIQALCNEFKAENGSIVCRELLGLNTTGADSPTPAERNANYYKKRPCAELAKCSADILEQYINSNK